MWSKYKDDVYQCIIVAIGCAIFGVGIDAFVLPHKLVSTGISGVGLILYYITGLSIGTWNVILNIPIFWAAWHWQARGGQYLVWYRHVVLDGRCL